MQKAGVLYSAPTAWKPDLDSREVRKGGIMNGGSQEAVTSTRVVCGYWVGGGGVEDRLGRRKRHSKAHEEKS